ncbi:uncharacterized protein [Anoplolepis gracilipes]|uniref:uncharacterized protein isoform X2 n=1 Tax=Anoplolepis gracilipes TaxID=354296 RepID=UPI003B9FFA39
MGEGRWTMFSGLGARLIEQANSLVDSMRRDTFDINASRYINHRLSITVECSRNSSLNAYNLSNRIRCTRYTDDNDNDDDLHLKAYSYFTHPYWKPYTTTS